MKPTIARNSRFALTGLLCLPLLGLAGCGGGDDPAPPAAASTVPNELLSEARPKSDLEAYFGGDTPADDSGNLQYVLIGESGVSFSEDEEVQGLTLEGVGSGTTIDHIQIFGSNDDGIEWFGGTVDVKYFVVQDVDDDGIDFDEGYNGVVQYGIVRQGPTGDAAIEADNAGPSDDAEPVTRPELANLLIMGNTGGVDGVSEGAHLKVGFGGDFEHVVFIDSACSGGAGAWDSAVFDVDNEVDSSLDARGVAWCATNGRDNADTDTFEADWAAGTSEAGPSTVAYNVTNDTGMSVDADFQVTTSATLDATVDTATAFYGAVDPAATDFASGLWYAGWTVPIGESTALTATDSSTPDYTHPLADDIGTDIVPSTGTCPSSTVANGSNTLTVFGEAFKTCLIGNPIMSNTTLTNGFVYILNGNVKVGNGAAQDKTNPANVVLSIEPGTQIYATGDTASLLRVTRGSQINAVGTADQPIIFSSVAMTGSGPYTITGNPLDLSERGQWGGIVVDGYAPTNSLDN